MLQMKASAFISNGSLLLFVNNTVFLKGSDSGTIDLKEGAEYIVHWFVDAPPGSSYSVTISSPRAAQYQLTRILGKSGKDLNSFIFNT